MTATRCPAPRVSCQIRGRSKSASWAGTSVPLGSAVAIAQISRWTVGAGGDGNAAAGSHFWSTGGGDTAAAIGVAYWDVSAAASIKCSTRADVTYGSG